MVGGFSQCVSPNSLFYYCLQSFFLMYHSRYVCVSHSVGSNSYNPMGSSVHWILQAGILEWIAIFFSRRSSQHRDQTQFSCTKGIIVFIYVCIYFMLQLHFCLHFTFIIFAFGRMAQSTIKYNFKSVKFSKVTHNFFPQIIRKKTWNFHMWKISYHKNCYCCFSHLSHVQLFVTPWTIIHQVPLSLRFSRQEYWSRLPFPSQGDLPDTGIKPMSPLLTGGFFTTEPPRKPILNYSNLCSIEYSEYIFLMDLF